MQKICKKFALNDRLYVYLLSNVINMQLNIQNYSYENKEFTS